MQHGHTWRIHGQKERVRELLTPAPVFKYLSRRAEEGWRLVALEREREVPANNGKPQWVEEVPYGVGGDRPVSGVCGRTEASRILHPPRHPVGASAGIQSVAPYHSVRAVC